MWTGHAKDYTDDIPEGVRAVNVAFRLAGLVMNSSNSWMVVMRMFITLNVVRNTPINNILNHIRTPMLIAIPWLIGIPFFVAHLVEALKDPDNTYRTPYFADHTSAYLYVMFS